MRFQFPVYKLFLIVAAYAVAFGFTFGLPAGARVCLALWVGTAGSLLVVLIRSKQDILRAFYAGLGGMIGLFFALFGSGLISRGDPFHVQFEEWLWKSLCVIAGVLLFSIVDKLDAWLQRRR